jgi:hypothetical protein
MFLITINALYVSGGFSNSPTLAVAASKLDIIPDAVCTVFELLMKGGETA